MRIRIQDNQINADPDPQHCRQVNLLNYPQNLKNQQCKVIFRGQGNSILSYAGIVCEIFKLTRRGLKNALINYFTGKSHEKSLSRRKWFYAPLVRLYD
jgi:hypothetical protein